MVHNNNFENWKFEDYDSHKVMSGKKRNDDMPSTDKLLKSFINPAFSPGLTRALLSAKKLLKYTEKQLAYIYSEIYDVENSYNVKSGMDDSLTHIHEVISKKFAEVNNSKQLNKSNEKIYAAIPKSGGRYKEKLKNNVYNRKMKKYDTSFCRQKRLCVEPKKIYTARSVQTNLEKNSDKSMETDNKLKKLTVQVAPSLTIPSSFKIQKLESVEILPNSSMTFENKNAEVYIFKYHNIDHEKSQTQENQKHDAPEFLHNCEKLKTKDNYSMKSQIDSKNETSIESSSIDRITRKPPLVPNESFKTLICQKDSKFQMHRSKRRLQFRESHLNISLETVHCSDIDNILVTNNDKLNQAYQKTSKICKNVYSHVIGKNFHNYNERLSSQISYSNIIDSSFEILETSLGLSEGKDELNILNQSKNSESFVSLDSQFFESEPVGRKELSKIDYKQMPKPLENKKIFDDSKSNEGDSRIHEKLNDEKINVELSVPLDDILQTNEKKFDEYGTLRLGIDNTRFVDNNGTFKTVEDSSFNKHKDVSLVESLIPIHERKEHFSRSNKKNPNNYDGAEIIYHLRDGNGENQPSCKMNRGKESTNEVMIDCKNDLESSFYKDEFIEVNETDISINHKCKSDAKSEKAVLNVAKKNSSINMTSTEWRTNFDNESETESCTVNLLKVTQQKEHLIEQISYQINEEMKKIIEATERKLSFLRTNSPVDCTSMSSSPDANRKCKSSESEHSEGEVLCSSRRTFSVGEVKLNSQSDLSKRKETHGMRVLNKTNSSLDTSVSGSTIFSAGEVWEKPSSINGS